MQRHVYTRYNRNTDHKLKQHKYRNCRYGVHVHKQTHMHPMGVQPTISPSSLNLQEEKMPFELELVGITGAHIAIFFFVGEGGELEHILHSKISQRISWSLYRF